LTKTPSLDPMLHAGQHDLARKIGVVGLRARSSKYSNGFESFDFNLGQKRANPNQWKSRPRSFCVPTRQSNRNDVRGRHLRLGRFAPCDLLQAQDHRDPAAVCLGTIKGRGGYVHVPGPRRHLCV
jgi:hypothetical protein